MATNSVKNSSSSWLYGLVVLSLAFGLIFLFAKVRKHELELRRLKASVIEELRQEQIEAIVKHVLSTPQMTDPDPHRSIHPIRSTSTQTQTHPIHPVSREQRNNHDVEMDIPFASLLQSFPIPLFGGATRSTSIHVQKPFPKDSASIVVEDDDENQNKSTPSRVLLDDESDDERKTKEDIQLGNPHNPKVGHAFREIRREEWNANDKKQQVEIVEVEDVEENE